MQMWYKHRLLQFHPKLKYHIYDTFVTVLLSTFRSVKEKIESYCRTDNMSKKWNGLAGFIDFVITSSESCNPHLRWQNTWSTCLGKRYIRWNMYGWVSERAMLCSHRCNTKPIQKSDENISNFLVSVVPADWLGHLKGLWWLTRDRHLLELLERLT